LPPSPDGFFSAPGSLSLFWLMADCLDGMMNVE
jgi:hypothetical protein